MPTIHMTVRHHLLLAGDTYEATAAHSAVRMLEGAMKSSASELGDGGYLAQKDRLVGQAARSSFLEFALWTAEPDGDFDAKHQFDCADGPAIFRLDQVSFGPGVCAYRHVHAGAGIRALIEGELTIIADDHTQVMRPGQAWFEPANSPVRAEASETAAQSTFVRAMVLPVEYEGKPTIQILDPAEAALPKRQKTQRFCDQRIQLSG